MIWIGKHPPLYVRKGDMWFNETNDKTYECDLEGQFWFCENDVIPFPKKTKLFS